MLDADIYTLKKEVEVSFDNVALKSFEASIDDYNIVQSNNECDVDLTKVIGSVYCAYDHLTWRELLPFDKRALTSKDAIKLLHNGGYAKKGIRNIEKLFSNPGYYTSRKRKKEWHFYCVDGRYYCVSGLQRTIIARYFLALNNLPEMIYGVHVDFLELL